MNNQPYFNAEGHKVLEYLSPDTIVLDLDFILTQGKQLTKGVSYLKVEKKIIGEDVAAVKLLGFQDYEGVIYLNVQDLKTSKCNNLTWNMEYEWGLVDVRLSDYLILSK